MKVILKLPIGKIVFLDKSLENMLHDIDNTTNTYGSEMINRRWIMTDKGLKCLDCKGLDEESSNTENDSDNSSKNENVKITVNGVDIKAKDSQVKLDSNGVKIKSKTTKLTIDEKGIHIDTENKK